MPEQTYHQFCPVAMAAEVLCTRWTMLVVRELIMGSTRFNELRRGLPRISPALLSQRLKELEQAGILERHASDKEAGVSEYHLTPMGKELEPLIGGFGAWGHRWISSELSLQRLDAQLLMWDIGRNLDIDPPPPVRKILKFQFPDCAVDVCSIDPGHDVDLYVTSDLRALTAVWMGLMPLDAALKSEQVRILGEPKLVQALPTWLKLSSFATVERMVA